MEGAHYRLRLALMRLRTTTFILVSCFLVSTMAAVSSAPILAATRPIAEGPGSRDSTFGRDGLVRIPTSSGVTSHGLTPSDDSGWWITAFDNHFTYVYYVDRWGRTDETKSFTIPGTRPIALDSGPAGTLRLLGRFPDEGLALYRIDTAGSVVNQSVRLSEGDRYFPHINDAIWTPAGVVVVGHDRSAVRQPAIGIIQNGTLDWQAVRASDSSAELSAVTATSDDTFVSTGAGSYPETGIRGYPLLSFNSALELIPGTTPGVLIDPRENCQFQMADIATTGTFNTVVGSTWGCDFAPDAHAVVVAQQYPSLLSHDNFGATATRSGEGAVRVLPEPGLNWRGRSISVDSQGRLVIVGTAVSTAAGVAWEGSPALLTPRPFSARLLADGTLDSSFELNALALVNSPWSWVISDVQVDESDRPVLLGTATANEEAELRIVRLLG